MAKESFIIYKSFYNAISGLPDDDLGCLFRDIFIYQTTGVMPPNTSRTYIAFMFFKNQFDLDEKKYEAVVNRNKTNGLSGGRPKNPNKLKETQKTQSVILKPKKADNDNVNDTVTDNVNENDKPKYGDYIPESAQVGELKAKILADTIWMGNTVFKINGVNQITVAAYLDDFITHLLKDSELHTEFPYKDKRQHFYNWLNLYAKNNKKDGKRPHSFI